MTCNTMSFIHKMPDGLSYVITGPIGARVTSLDMTKTAVNMVPRGLEGVDRVIVNQGQLAYVAPDYRGKVVVAYQAISGYVMVREEEEMKKNEVNSLKIAYQQALSYSPLFFDVSSTDNFGHEQHLPADLVFDRRYRVLDASKTVLTTKDNENLQIAGVNAKVMPDRLLQYNLDQLRCKRNKLKKEAARKDHGYVREVCHYRTRKSISDPDRLVR